ncbi:MAG: winged helix-turn-helix domain-containing protein [Nitrososphaerales archaeon]
MSSRRKRGTLSITENILNALKDGEELKTHIAYKSKIDSRTIEKYIKFLSQLSLIKETPIGKYRITRKGLEFLRKYEELKTYGVMDDSI